LDFPSGGERGIHKEGGGTVIRESNNAGDPLRRDASVFPTIWLDRLAASRPDDVAVTFGGTSTTYRQLQTRSMEWAGAILRATDGSPGAVPLIMKTNSESFAALLGALRAGATTVPLSPSDAPERTRRVLEMLRPRVVVAAGNEHASLIHETTSLLISDGVTSKDSHDGVPLNATDPARIVFTSGSTGAPKGTVWSHEGIAGHVSPRLASDGIDSNDRVSLLHEFPFAASHRATFGSLLAGARICIFDARNDPLTSFGEWLVNEQISILHTTPNLLRTLMNINHDDSCFASVRRIRLGADRTLPSDLHQILARVRPDCVVSVGYAATEVGSISAVEFTSTSAIPADRLPVGRPVPGRTVRIVDDDGVVVPPGEVGEIMVMLDQPISWEFKPASWRTNPSTLVGRGEPASSEFISTGDRGSILPDGQIDLVGRSNARVKIRGFGVDLTEVENALNALDAVRLAAVVVEPDRSSPRLVAHVASLDSFDFVAAQQELTDSLPPYAVPNLLVRWDDLPLTSRGKLDRARMIDASRDLSTNGDAAEVGDDLEVELQQIWCDVLDVRDVGIADRFFDVGGDSLLAYELVEAIRIRVRAHMTPASLLSASTIQAQAALIRNREGIRGVPLVPFVSGGDGAPAFFTPGVGGDVFYARRMAAGLMSDRSVYGFQIDDAEALDGVTEIAEIADRYVEDVISNHGGRPVLVGGYSFAGKIAWDLARRLHDRGVEIESVIIVDTRLDSNRELLETPGLVTVVGRIAHIATWFLRSALREPATLRQRLAGRLQRQQRQREFNAWDPIKDRLTDIGRGWTPKPVSFPVIVIGTETSERYHAKTWGEVARAGYRFVAVPRANHLDMIFTFADDTAAVMASAVGRSPNTSELENRGEPR
jgi:acyl-coenzyme A synthetase/AMP-(fatty) acid ligase/thioesterase domain-containing protein